ncbi:Kinetochore subunit NKP2 [Penicillium herquei]|nr:Kinetochore subunit NKP2 [Penicillium herquei]
MAPSEESILSNFLLTPSPLPTVLSLQKFTELFPKRLRKHPHVRALYRELQHAREHDLDQVNENIDMEIQQGERQKAELRKAILTAGVKAANDEEQREMDLDLHLFGQNTADPEDYHSTESLLAEMEAACSHIEREMSYVDQEATDLVAKLNTTVGDLSDLRYGKFPGPGSASDVAEEAIKGLQHLEDTCYQKTIPGAS